jgi:glycerol uptake facilitator-like aquaporin
MTSGQHSQVPLSSITINRAERQRRVLDEQHITALVILFVNGVLFMLLLYSATENWSSANADWRLVNVLVGLTLLFNILMSLILLIFGPSS